MALAISGVLEASYLAGGAITKYRFVELSADETVTQVNGAGDRALGVFQVDVSAQEATDGKGGAVMILGISWVEASAAISQGAVVGSANDGRAKTAITTEVPAGVALKAAGAAGDWFPVLLTPGLPAV